MTVYHMKNNLPVIVLYNTKTVVSRSFNQQVIIATGIKFYEWLK